VGVLLATSLVYTYGGTISRETYRTTWLPENSVPYTLDGMAFMKVAYPADYAAISWLNAHVRGAPVIAEAGEAYYNWRSRVSMFTGLPTILDGIHEPEQRYDDEIHPTQLCQATSNPGVCPSQVHDRDADLKTLYDSSSIADAWRVIRAYGVKYIYVGFSERECDSHFCYSRAGLAKFNRMVGHGVSIAYHNTGTIIYEVGQA
jgi:uncharacterized membrane protein